MPDRDDDLSPFADALRRLAPQPPEISRDALLFSAGKAAARSGWQRWAWPTAAIFFACTTLILGAFLVSPGQGPTTRIEYVYVNAPAPTSEPVAEPPLSPVVPPITDIAKTDKTSQWKQALKAREDILRFGIEAIPRSPGQGDRGPGGDVTARDVDRWLAMPPGTFALPPAPKHSPRRGSDDEEDGR